MNLKRVTITGADDHTSIEKMMYLSQYYPFVEWGILVSRRQEGTPRFPSRQWIGRLVDGLLLEPGPINISMHVCGAWVRQMLVGELNWSDLPSVLKPCQRIQINTHAEVHASSTGLWKTLGEQRDKEFIFQWDGVNDHLTHAALAGGLKVSALFDTSGGAGILPKSWPPPIKTFSCGYAGGLGPENVVENIRKIEAVCDQPYWIDMERKVRSADDSVLDMDAVTQVLKYSGRLMESAQ